MAVISKLESKTKKQCYSIHCNSESKVKASLENAVNYAKLTAFFYPFYPKEEHMTNEKIAKEEAILAKRREQARKAKDAEKQQKRKLAKLKRDARTHQLCERGGELNRLLLRPDDLTDEQVKRFLQEVFALAAVQEKLAALLPPNLVEEVVQELESEQQEEPEEPLDGRAVIQAALRHRHGHGKSTVQCASCLICCNYA